MTTDLIDWTAGELWIVLKKEITGIQALWETVEGMYLNPQGYALSALKEDTRLVSRLIQTALMESILVRMSRLMDQQIAVGRKATGPI